MKKNKTNKSFKILTVITLVIIDPYNTFASSDEMNTKIKKNILDNKQYALNDYTELTISYQIEQALSIVCDDLNQKLQKASLEKDKSKKLPKLFSLRRGHPGLLVLDMESEPSNFYFSYLDEIKSYFENSNVAGVYIRFHHNDSVIYEIYLPVKTENESYMKNSVILTERFYDRLQKFIVSNRDNLFVEMMIKSGQLEKEFSELKMNHEKHVKMIEEILELCESDDGL